MAGPSGISLALLLVAASFSFFYTGPLDALLLAFFSMTRQRHALLESAGISISRGIAWTAGIAGLLAFILFRILEVTQTSVGNLQWKGPGKVLLFPCRTTHSRLFPKKHSFSYSYLVVGIPVGWEGTAGGMVSVGENSGLGFSSWFSLKSCAGNGWYSVDAGDYLERGNSGLGLRGKLDAYLRSQVRRSTPFSSTFGSSALLIR